MYKFVCGDYTPRIPIITKNKDDNRIFIKVKFSISTCEFIGNNCVYGVYISI